MAKALDGVTVVEFAGHMGSAYAAMLMAEQGARTIRIEPRDGDPGRGTPHFHVLNRSKQAVFLDVDSSAGRAQAHELIRIADVVVSGFTPARQRAAGLDYESVRRINPSALLLQMPPLGSRGPYADLPVADDLMGAWGGIFATQVSRSGNPVALMFPLVSYQAGLLGAAAATAGLIARDNGGTGQPIEVSELAAALSLQTGDLHLNPNLRISQPGPADPLGVYPVIYLYRGSDGHYLIVDCTSARFCQRLAAAIGMPELFSDPRFKDAPWNVGITESAALREIIGAAFRTRPRDAWIRILREHQVPAAPVWTRQQFIEDPQVRYLGMRREVDDPTLGPTLQMGVPIHLSRTPGDISGPAPALDQTNVALGALLEEARGKKIPAAAATQSTRSHNGRGPLSGITVVDFSSYIAGAFGPMILAQMGATVIKIEGRDGDSLRHVVGFRGWNQSKRGLGLDAKSPQGLEIVYDLVRKADVFVENLRPGGIQRFGLDYERLSAINPRLIYMTVTGYGSNGPDYDRPGLDPLAQALSGAFAAHSGEHRRPGRNDGDSPRHPIYINTAICDYGGATLGALGCILALRARQVTGMGQHGETSLLHAAMALQAGEFIFYPGRPDLENGAPELRGDTALHRAYQCADGKWLYISVSDSAPWEALRAQIPALAPINFDHARLEDPDGELAERLSEFFHASPSQTLFDALVARGIPVSPVLHVSQLFEDAQVIANELAIDVEDPRLGVVKEPAPFAKFSGVTASAKPAPQLGEHSAEILAEILGYDADRIAKLREAGVIFGG